MSKYYDYDAAGKKGLQKNQMYDIIKVGQGLRTIVLLLKNKVVFEMKIEKITILKSWLNVFIENVVKWERMRVGDDIDYFLPSLQKIECKISILEKSDEGFYQAGKIIREEKSLIDFPSYKNLPADEKRLSDLINEILRMWKNLEMLK